MTLRIGGLTPLTTLDYPGHLACVVFCQGCAWRCGYCHNPELVWRCGNPLLTWADVRAFLQRRQGLLEAVVFSGGEATLQPGLLQAMQEAKALGFRVGLHSAGIHPARFARALAVTDWVGFDVKALPEDSQRITGVRGSGEANWRSLHNLLASGVDHECRTTVHWGLMNLDSVWRLALKLQEAGVKRYAVQRVRSGRMLDSALGHAAEPASAPALWNALRELFTEFELRG
jgi:pyruvate formate lyase activating enzyme